jgi:hypothetical protein
MKRTFLFCSVFSLFLIFGCQDSIIESRNQKLSSSSLDSIPTQRSARALADSLSKIQVADSTTVNIKKSESYFTDWSGKVTVCISSGTSAPSQSINENFFMGVPSGYVCIGGGATLMGVDNQSGGAFLVDSRPKSDFSAWIVSSKDHRITDPHYLDIYAVGLKIEGVTKQELLNRLILRTNTSPGRISHPTATAYVDSGYDLIGGGADITYYGAGCLLSESYPNAGAWIATGKDHTISDPSIITSYAIGIQHGVIPNFGELEISTVSSSSYASSGLCFVSTPITSGWVKVGVGGKCQYNDKGRMFEALNPYGSNNTVISKDHYYSDGGTTTGYNILIRKKP